MKRFLCAITVVSFLPVMGCSRQTEGERETKRLAEIAAWKRTVAASVMDGIMYIKDGSANPPVCIGYFWGGSTHGGPAAFTAPCGSVEHLIVNK